MPRKLHTAAATEVEVEYDGGVHRPGETITVSFASDAAADLALDLQFPLDLELLTKDLRFRRGRLALKMRAALPGRYIVSLRSVSGGSGHFLLRIGNRLRLLSRESVPIAVVDVCWGSKA